MLICNNAVVRKLAAKLGLLVSDTNVNVRIAVAEQQFGLEKLVDDECNDVRLAVAKQRFGLYQLANGSCPEVRKAVAKHGFSLHKLVNDSNWKYVKQLQTEIKLN